MVSFRFFALLPFVVAALASPLATRDAVTVETDIHQKIAPVTTTLDNDVQGFPASGLSGALAIHNDTQSLLTIVNGATSNVKSAGSFSEADGTSILASIQAIVPTFLSTLSTIAAQKADWANIPGGQALMLSDLQSVNTSLTGYINAWIAATPTDLVGSATSVKTQIDGAFTSTIAAYSS